MKLQQSKKIVVTGKSGTGKTKLANSLIKKFSRVIIVDTLCEYNGDHIFYSFSNFLELDIKEKEKFVYVLRDCTELEIKYLCRYSKILKNVLIVIEEFEQYLMLYDVQDLFRRGRHYGVSLLLISQRVPDFEPSIRAQITTFITFNHDEPIDLKYLELRGLDVNIVKNLKYSTSANIPVENVHYLLQGEKI